MEDRKPVRMNLYLSYNVKELVNHYSAEMGMTQSAFMTMCVNQFIDQKRAVEGMSNIDELLKRFDDLERRLDSSQE